MAIHSNATGTENIAIQFIKYYQTAICSNLILSNIIYNNNKLLQLILIPLSITTLLFDALIFLLEHTRNSPFDILKSWATQ